MNEDLKVPATTLNDADLEEVSGGLTFTIGGESDPPASTPEFNLPDLSKVSLSINGEIVTPSEDSKTTADRLKCLEAYIGKTTVDMDMMNNK